MFTIHSAFSPAGDQPGAIDKLSRGVDLGVKDQVLLGVTGSGKTFTMAQIIARTQRPTLVMAPNKTLAAQLFAEFKELFPENAVEYFVSYYDYYQPEAYIPQSDTYIDKDSSINDTIDKMRHSATRSLLTRHDVLIVASVSCIYGLGSPDEYKNMHLFLKKDEEYPMEEVIRRLVYMLYERNDYSFHRGTFRVKGDVIDVFPAYEENLAVRVEFFGDTIEAITLVDPLRGEVLDKANEMTIYPSSHFVTSKELLARAMNTIKEELIERVAWFEKNRRLLEAQRIDQRTMYDLEMISELGYCNGIENYSRHLTGRKREEPPPNLLDYFPDDFLLFIDESHITVPQIGGMYKGDRSRKKTLVEFGFRLPSALDNRPLRFEEFDERLNQVIYVSATPGDFEIERADGRIVEQVIRPTGLLDPLIIVRPATSQVDDLLEEIRQRTAQNEAVLVTTLTKRMSEDLTDYYEKLGVQVRYLHSDIKTLDRIELVKDLRRGDFNVLIGINLLREGLDIPEVSLVAILDADKEGFLRSERSLTQTCGRASRNDKGTVIMYADKITGSMQRTIDETNRRRTLQQEHNRTHSIIPQTVKSSIKDVMETLYEKEDQQLSQAAEDLPDYKSLDELRKEMKKMEGDMLASAKELDFEKAAVLRDKIKLLKEKELLWL